MNQKLFERTEEYLNGEMSDEERSKFRLELSNDNELAALFEKYNFIDKEMRPGNQFAGQENDTAAFIRTLRSSEEPYFDITADPSQRYLDVLMSNDQREIKKVYSGDEEFETYKRNIKTWIMKNSGSEEDAEETMSIALINLFKKAKSGFVLTVPFSGFFYRECTWVWLGELDKRIRNRTKELDEESSIMDNTISYESRTEADYLLKRILSVLPQLSEKHRELIILHFMHGKKIKELTPLLGYGNDSHTRTTLFRSIRQLKELLGTK